MACAGGNKCVVHDMRIFVLSILSIIAWIVFTASFAVLLNDDALQLQTLFAGVKDINALTFVHYMLACLGWVGNAFCLWYATREGKNACLGTFCMIFGLTMLIVAGGIVNDYGRVYYTINVTLKGLVDTPDDLKAAMAGALMFILFEICKTVAFFLRTPTAAGLPYTRN
jgi:hypothetical protein